MSDTLTANNGFPLASATLSGAFQSGFDRLDGKNNKTHLLSTSCPHPGKIKSKSASNDLQSLREKQAEKSKTLNYRWPFWNVSKFPLGLGHKASLPCNSITKPLPFPCERSLIVRFIFSDPLA